MNTTREPLPSIPAYARPAHIDVTPDTVHIETRARATSISAHAVYVPGKGPASGSIRIAAEDGQVFEISGDLADLRGFAEAFRQHVYTETTFTD